MDIRNWPMDRIMQLPDNCFGSRWLVSVSREELTVDAFYDISEAALPERCVIWGLNVNAVETGMVNCRVSLALGDQLPATDAEFDSNEQIFRDLGIIVIPRRRIVVSSLSSGFVLRLRKPVEARGRRLIGRFEWEGTGELFVMAVIEVSSVPTEVPDWLVSGRV